MFCFSHFLRLLPTCKKRNCIKSLPLHAACSRLYSTSANCVQTAPDKYEVKNTEINFDILFNYCTNTNHVKCLHALLTVSGKAKRIFITTKLVNLYAHYGDIISSRKSFDQIPYKDAYTWNSMISAYVRNRCYDGAFDCLYNMLCISEVRPDFHTFPPIFKACGNLNDGRMIHSWVCKLGFEPDVFVAASLVHMYCKFGSFDVAHKVFDNMPVRDMGCWNAIISGFCQNGKAVEALGILDEMRLEGIKMDPVTVATILPVCAQTNDLLRGVLIHLDVIKIGVESDIFVSNALINMYAKFGKLKLAQKVFDQMYVRDLVSWNSIIAAYEQNYYPDTALKFFSYMKSDRIRPDFLTLVSVASSIGQSKDIRNSKSVHGFVLRRCWIMEDVIVANAIMDMYAKLGTVDSSRKVFETVPIKDSISWNTVITGYTQNGLASEAIEVYNMMKQFENITPNQGTWVSILPAYAHVGALQEGSKVHGRVVKAGLNSDIYVGTCLIDLYGKCGKLKDALTLFDEVPRTSSVSWNAIISCHAIHGHAETSLELFKNMVSQKVNPDHITFVSLISACSHAGLVDQGQWCFDIMQSDHNIEPSMKHYGCMVDLLGRAGHLEKAYEFIKKMPLKPDSSIYGALLGACRIHGNVELGKIASEKLFEVDSNNVGYYVLLSNMYANLGKWEGVNEVRSLAREKGLRKTPGWSSMELNNKIEVFYTGNQSHPQCDEIYKELEILTAKIKGLGYAPDYSFVLQDVEEDEKQFILTSHSERLAIAYGILNTPPKSVIRIFKNLRVCGDCHTATKYISLVTEREIIVRDSNRFHHFKNGVCSCGDFW